MPGSYNTEGQVAYMAFLHRENAQRHHYYDEEMKQYRLMQAGDPAAVEESARMMSGNLHGHLSNDPLREVKYLFVANITLTTRFAIEGGMDSEKAYNTSDLYISRMDQCRTPQEVLELHREMFGHFTTQMANLDKENVIARPVRMVMDYVNGHLHERITVEELAGQVKLNASYLSVLFKKEVGIPLSDYIMKRRIDVAKEMLLHSSFTSSQIASFLAFSSQSHFIRSFHKQTGLTPREFQKRSYRKGIRAASEEETKEP